MLGKIVVLLAVKHFARLFTAAERDQATLEQYGDVLFCEGVCTFDECDSIFEPMGLL